MTGPRLHLPIRLLTAFFILASAMTIHLSVAHPLSVTAASSTQMPCNPDRDEDSAQYVRVDEWENPAMNDPGEDTTGIESYFTDYQPYVSSIQNVGNYDYDWVMLDNDQNVPNEQLVQIGIVYEYGHSAVPVILYTDGANNFEPDVPLNSYTLTTGETVGFKITWSSSGGFGLYIDTGSGFSLVYTLLPRVVGNFTPYQGLIAGETHNNADQMPGDTVAPETFSSDYIQFNNASYVAFGQSGAVSFNEGSANGEPPFTPNSEFGWNENSTTAFSIWDKDCAPIAYQGTNNNLYVVAGTSNDITGSLGDMDPGTSPSIEMLPDGSYDVAYEGAHGNLWIYESLCGCGVNSGQGMNNPDTSPAITALSGGGYEVAFMANIGTLYTYGSSDTGTNRDVSMEAYTSPGITAQGSNSWTADVEEPLDGGYTLIAYNSSSGASSGLGGMLEETNPSITTLSSGLWEAGFVNSSGNICSYLESFGYSCTSLNAYSISPDIASHNGYSTVPWLIAFDAGPSVSGCTVLDLCTYSSSGAIEDSDTGTGGESPSIASLIDPDYSNSFVAAVQDQSQNLWEYSSVSDSSIQIVNNTLEDGTSPSIAS